MKKLLLIAILMLALVFTVVACTGGETPDDTTVGDTTVETPTEAPTDEPDDPTEAPTDKPEDPTDVPTEAPTDEPEDPTEAPTDEPAKPTEPTVTLDKTEYQVGESIMISATGSGKDWVGIVIAGTDYSIRWWYVADVGEGVAIDALNDSHIQAGTGAATGALPGGEYEVVWVANDQSLNGADKAYRYKFTIKDPSAPVLMLKPEDLNTLAGAAAPNVNQLGSSEVITEGSNTFVRWTAAGGDPYVAIIPLGSSYTLPQYMAIRYRTNSAVEGQFFMGSGAGWTGKGDSFMVTWAEGDWNYVIVDVTQTGITSVTDGLVTYARLDFFAGDSAEGDYFDIAYIGVFNTAEDALKYDFEQYPPYIEADDTAAGKVAHSFDTFYVNGGMYFPEDGGAGDKLTAQNNTITFGVGEAHDTMTLRGWVGFNQPMAALGYFVDGYTMVYGDFFKPTEDGVKAAGGANASRFEITVPLGELTAGFHTVGFVAKLEDGTVVRLRENLTVVIIPFTAEEEIVLAARAGGSTPIVPAGQAMGQRFTVNGYLKQIAVADMATYNDGNTNTWNLKVWAWDTDYATTIAAEPLYSVDGENHSDNQTLAVMIPIEKMITGDVYYEVTYLSGSGSFTGWNAQGAVVEGLETYIGGSLSDVHFASSILIGVEADPDAVKMDSHNFQSTAAGNYTDADVDFLQTDLTGCFNVTYGQGNDNHCFVKNGDNGPFFWMGVFNSIHTTANGAYVFSVDDVVAVNPGFASVVVRANLSANPEGKLYGSDGNDATTSSHGGSGIYLTMDGSNLVINVKGYADGAYVANKFTVAVDSNDIKIADDGEKVYVLAGETLVATIAISGTKDFGIKNVPADALAETVTVTLADGTTQTVENAVVASRNNNGALGVATRGGGQITFTAISLMPFDSIEIPSVEPEEPVVPEVETLVIPQDQWVISGHMPHIVYPDQEGHGPMISAGGVESAALLHQGSIALGEIDLSKYSKVVIMWGSDNGDGTKDLYAKNEHNRFALVNADKNMVMSPAEDTIIAAATYELHGWAVAPIEIDLTGIDYNGPVFLTHDSLAGGFALVYSIEFVA